MLQALRLMCAAMTALVPISGMAACAPPLAGPDRWAVAAPEAVGLDLNRLCALVPWIEGSRESDIHAVLVARHDQLVFEQYFSGADERWGTPIGNAMHSNDQLHDARSVTKSVVALVLGIALDHGLDKAGLNGAGATRTDHLDRCRDAADAKLVSDRCHRLELETLLFGECRRLR